MSLLKLIRGSFSLELYQKYLWFEHGCLICTFVTFLFIRVINFDNRMDEAARYFEKEL
jgi:hypothetical protein